MSEFDLHILKVHFLEEWTECWGAFFGESLLMASFVATLSQESPKRVMLSGIDAHTLGSLSIFIIHIHYPKPIRTMKKLFVILLCLGLFSTISVAQKNDYTTQKVFRLVNLETTNNADQARKQFQQNRRALVSADVLSQDAMKQITARVKGVMNGKSDKQLLRFCQATVQKMDKADFRLFVAGLNEISEDNGGESVSAQSSNDIDWVTVGTIVGGGVGAVVGLVAGIADVVPGDEGAWVAAGTAAGAAGGAAAGAFIEGTQEEGTPNK